MRVPEKCKDNLHFLRSGRRKWILIYIFTKYLERESAASASDEHHTAEHVHDTWPVAAQLCAVGTGPVCMFIISQHAVD